MKCGRTFRRRKRKSSENRVGTEILPEWLMSQWICTNGFNKRECHVAVKYFNGDLLYYVSDSTWLVKLNTKKCKVMSFFHRHYDTKSNNYTMMNDDILEEVDSYKDLDVLFDPLLLFHQHVSKTVSKAYSMLGPQGPLTANPRPLRTDLSCPACIASGNFVLEFPSINSPILTPPNLSSVEQTESLAARACANVRIAEFMLGNSRTKLPTQCMLGRRGQFEGVAFRNAESGQPCI